MPLDATIGGTNSNSYVTREEATAYFANRLYSSKWDDTDPDDQNRALITATKRLDQEDFEGLKVNHTQPLKWPRVDTYDPDGCYYQSTIIPQPVKDAVCELALDLVTSDVLKQSKLVNFAHIKIGPLDITPQQPQTSGALPAQALRLLAHLLATARGTIRMVRG